MVKVALRQASGLDRATSAASGNREQASRRWGARELLGRSAVAVAGMPPVAVKIDAGRKNAGTQAPHAKKNRLGEFIDRLFASTPWIAGQRREDAAKKALQLQERGVGVIVDIVGESVSTKEAVEGIRDEYLALISLLREKGVKGATIAVRPSALGVDVGDGDWRYCHGIMGGIAKAAKEAGYIVDIDMESSKYTDITLWLYEKLQWEYRNMGTVIQAMLHRSINDYKRIMAEPNFDARIRLVKGIYEEPQSVAYTEFGRIHENFKRLIRVGFESNLLSGKKISVIVATHHEGQILEALLLLDEHKRVGPWEPWQEFEAPRSIRPEKTLEIQMLMGVKPQLAKLMEEASKKLGFKFTLYVPYGRHPAAYCMRRMVESGSFARMMVETLVEQWGVPNFLKQLAKPIMHLAAPVLGRVGYRIITGKALMKPTGHSAADKAELEKCRRSLYAYLQMKGVQVPEG